MVSLVIYNLMRQVGAGHASGGSISLIVTYFTMRAVSPGFFLWAQGNEWAGYLHMILSLAVIVSVWRVIIALLSSSDLSSLKRSVSKTSFGKNEFIDSYKREDLSGLSIVKTKAEEINDSGKTRMQSCDQYSRTSGRIHQKAWQRTANGSACL